MWGQGASPEEDTGGRLVEVLASRLKTGQRDLLRDWREGSRERERRKFEEDRISFPRLLQQHQALVA